MIFFAAAWRGPAQKADVERAVSAYEARYGAPAVSRRTEQSLLMGWGAAVPGGGAQETETRLRILPHLSARNSGPSDALNEAASLAVPEAKPETFLSPFCVLELGEDGLRAAQDFLGSARIFLFESAGLVILTNRIQPAQAASGKRLCLEAMRYFAAAGQLVGDQTFDAGYRILRPGEIVHITTPTGGPVIQTQYATAMDFSGDAVSTPEEFAEILQNAARSVISHLPEGVTLGLSGGRDSRMMAVIFESIGAQVKYNTVDNFPGETEVALGVAKALGVLDRHQVSPVNTQSPTEAVDPFATAEAMVRHFDGLHEPNYLGRRAPPTTEPFIRTQRIQISGANGEMLHGQFYPRGPLWPSMRVMRMDREDAIDWVIRRLSGNAAPSPVALETMRSLVRRSLREAPPMKDGVRILDYFYLMHKQRRWSSLPAGNNVAAPMANSVFINASFAMPAKDINDSIMPRLITQAVNPAVGALDYYKHTASSPTNLISFDRAVCTKMMDRVDACDALEFVIDRPALRAMVADDKQWKDVKPPRRDGALKRALWLAEVADQFG